MSELTDEQIDLVRSRICPFCRKGPFRSLASHTSPAHDVTSRDLKLMTGQKFYGVSFTSPEQQRRNASTALERLGGKRFTSGPRRGKPDVSPAGRAAMAAGIAKNKGTEKARRVARIAAKYANTPEARAKAARTRAERLQPAEHGTLLNFRRGCRCPACVEVEHVRAKAWRRSPAYLLRRICEQCEAEYETYKYSKVRTCPTCRRTGGRPTGRPVP